MTRTTKTLVLSVVFLSGLSAFFSLYSLAGFISLFNTPLRGDLLLRSEELKLVLSGFDPATVNAKYGYPSWAYVTSFLWFLPFGIDDSTNLYVFIQLIILCLAGLFLMLNIRSSLPPQLRLVILLGALPWFPLREQVNFLNYGIIVLAGLLVFVFSKNLAWKGIGLALALIKPALCVPAIIVSIFKGSNLKTIIMPLVIACIALVIQAAVALHLYSGGLSSISTVFSRYLPSGSTSNSYYVSGDYGILNKLVKLDVLPESLAIMLLIAGMTSILYWLRFRNADRCVDPIDFQMLSFGLVPLFTFYRSHDLVIIWPALYIILLNICDMRRAKQWIAFLVILFLLYYRGSGGGSLYLYAFSLASYLLVKYPPRMLSQAFAACK